MKKIFLLILILSFTACTNFSSNVDKTKSKVGKFKVNNEECPPQAERTLKDVLCKEKATPDQESTIIAKEKAAKFKKKLSTFFKKKKN